MRVLVCGGRDYADVPHLWRALDRIDEREMIRLVIDGACPTGADYWGHQWALARNKPTSRFLPDWDGYGKAAGPIRNQRMIDEGKPDLVVAFPGGKGTADMVRRAKAAGVRVIEVSG